MPQSPTIGELTKALCAAQAEFDNAVKDSKNPFFNSTYADLTSVFDACRKQLAKHGLAVSQPLRESDDGVIVETVLMHTSGEWISGDLKLKPVKNDPQGIGSCITYGRRFSLESLLGIAREDSDDDGNAASQPEKKSAEKKAPPRSAPADKGGGATTPPATPKDEEDEGALRDHLAAVCSEIAKKRGMIRDEGEPDWQAVLFNLTVNAAGKYGKLKTEDIAFKMLKKNGEEWSPLKATISKAEKELEYVSKKAEELGWEDVLL